MSLPLSNRPETILGSSISLTIVAVFSVALRIYSRYKLGHGYGFDDLFVVLACTSSVVGTVFVCIQPAQGLGLHELTLTFGQIETYLRYTYGMIASYATSTALIKISILLQYIRIARQDYYVFKRICIGLVVLVGLWGIGFVLSTLFSCSPISGFWNLLEPAHCVFFGSRNDHSKINAYVAQAVTNMTLDIIVFALPVCLINSVELSRRSKIGITGIFTLGALVVTISILRLESILRHQLGLMGETPDTTWYTPITIIWAVLEVNIAVICASIPTFWPVLEMGWGKIYVVNEVVVKSEKRMSRAIRPRMVAGQSDEDDYELALNLGWRDAESKSKVSSF